MNKTNMSKTKTRKYYSKQGGHKKPTIEFNSKGFLCSCNNREKDCIKEAYNLLNEYADKLYPKETTQVEQEQEDLQDISESLNKEISDLKDVKPNVKRFQVVDSGARNFLFIRTTLDNPVKLAETIMKDVHETSIQKTKFLLRMIPVEVTCRAAISDITDVFSKIAEKHFKDTAQTFSIMFNHRNNNVIRRDEVIKVIADKVSEFRTDHKVDLKTAKLTIIVEIIKGLAFLSIIPDYLKYKKYNLLSVCSKDHEVGDD